MEIFHDSIFKLISKKEPNSKVRMQKLMKALNVTKRSVLNRMRGIPVLRIDEIRGLMAAFDISWMDLATLFGEVQINSSPCDYMSLKNDNFFHKLPSYLSLFRQTMEDLLKMEDPWVKIVCSEVPLFHLFRFRQLTYFKLYMYYYHTSNNPMCFEEFRERVQLLGLDSSFETISQAYAQVKSEEIWDRYTFGKFMLLIKECYQYGKFNKQDTLKQLLDEADALAAYLEECVESMRKDNLETVEIYEFESTIREGFMVFGSGGHATKFCQTIFMIQSFTNGDLEVIADYNDYFRAQVSRSNSLLKSSRSKQRTFGKHFKLLVDQYKGSLDP